MHEDGSRFSRAVAIAGVVLGIAAVLALGVYLTATAYPTSRGKTVIRWAVDAAPIRKETIKLFESKHCDIHVINDPGPEVQRLLTQVAGGVPPDVMALYSPETIRMLASNDVLLDLTPYVRQHKLPVDKLYPSLAPYMYCKGKIIGVPENCGPFIIFYNRKLFREAGVPYPKQGWTWAECLAAAKKLTKYKTVAGRKVPVQKGLHISNTDWFNFIWMYGGRLFSADGKRCLMDSEQVKRGIRYWADLRLKYGVIPTTSEAASMAPTGSWGSDALLFRESRVAMVLSGRWMCIQYREQKDLDWDVTSVPRGTNRVTVLASKTYAIPKTCRHKAAAIAFLRHLLEKDNQLLVANYGDGMPTVDDPEITKAFLYNPQYPNETNNKVHIDEMKYARCVDSSAYINDVDVYAILNEELDMMWLKQQTPEQACDAIAERINAIIRRNIANPNFL
jgi:multiple sugar transport system substrate-binding protein